MQRLHRNNKRIGMTSISFGIVTGGNNEKDLQKIVDSIVNLNIPEYEIIIVGGEKLDIPQTPFLRHIPFDESIKASTIAGGVPGRWTTRKKNIAVRESQYEVCVVTHDYVSFHPDWYKEFEKFGTHWDICVHRSLNFLGARADEWRIGIYPGLPWACMVPYDMKDLVQYMCIQGNYACVKREHLLKYPFDENRLWGQAEDVEWSKRIVPNSHVVMNPNCIIQYIKPRPWDQRQATEDVAQMNAHMHIFDILRKCRIENAQV